LKHVFIINPHAGKKNQTSRIYEMADTLREKHGLECACMLTDRPGGATDIARKLAESGEDLRIYACGGDGTVSEVANGIAGFPNAAMSVIPIGTGNDFLKNFGADLEKFQDVENLWDGEVQPLDLIDCNGRLCLTIACSGLDARVAEDVHRYGDSPALSGMGSYIAAVAVNFLASAISRTWTVTLNGGKPVTDRFTLISLCNGRYYGGGFFPMPEARMNDGILQALIVRKVTRPEFLRLVGPYSKGKHRQLPPRLIQAVEVKELRITADEDIVTSLDGECFRSREVVMRLSEKRLNFFGPKGCDPNATASPAE
jgi:YegS/Rv2252/BmrU family lipid kinase